MNFLKGKLIKENDKSCFKLDKLDFKIKLSLSSIKESVKNLAFRPQHIYITNEDDYDLELRVFGIENLGKETIVICEYGEEKIRIITEKFTNAIGSVIKLKIDKEKILFF